MILTSAQKQMIYVLLTVISGPLVNILTREFHLAPDEAKQWLDLLSAITVAIGAAWGISVTTPTGLGQSVAALSPEAQHEVLKPVSDAVKVQAAEAVPGVVTVVVKDVANGALAALAQSDAHPNIVTETQNEIDAKNGTKT